MTTILAATHSGCLAFKADGEVAVELSGRVVNAICAEGSNNCLAVVDGKEIWRRNQELQWSHVANSKVELSSIVDIDGTIMAATADAKLVLITRSGDLQPLESFESIDGRESWFGQGPPLHIRALTATSDFSAVLAAVHVGGIPRSADSGQSWAPTVPIDYDVHEVRAHPTMPKVVAAAAAVGLCVSEDSGRSWKVLDAGPEDPHSLSLAALEEEVVFSVQDGPFAEKAQIWRWHIGDDHISHLRDGLPDWLPGKVDSGHIAAGSGRAAIIDGAGNVWLSTSGIQNWQRIASTENYIYGMMVIGNGT